MPLYDYKCVQCGKVIEVRHGFDDGHDAPCPTCGGELKRVFSAAPIVFKGSGFYVNDSRKSSATSSPSESHAAASDSPTKAEAPKPTEPAAKSESATSPTSSSNSAA